VLDRIENEQEEEAARPPLVVHYDTKGTFVAKVTAFLVNQRLGPVCV